MRALIDSAGEAHFRKAASAAVFLRVPFNPTLLVVPIALLPLKRLPALAVAIAGLPDVALALISSPTNSAWRP
jgi:hypothetical protein